MDTEAELSRVNPQSDHLGEGIIGGQIAAAFQTGGNRFPAIDRSKKCVIDSGSRRRRDRRNGSGLHSSGLRTASDESHEQCSEKRPVEQQVDHPGNQLLPVMQVNHR